MWPKLLEWHGFTLHTYGLFVGLGFLAGYGWFRRESARRGWPEPVPDGVFAISLIAGLLGSRAAYALLFWESFRTRPVEILKIWTGGLVFYGGLAAAGLVCASYLWRRYIPLAAAADAAAPSLAIGQAIGRLGCFSAGCCYGKVASVPWAVTFRHPESLAPLLLPLHPVQLYEAAGNLMLFAVLAARNGRRPIEGTTAALYLCLYGALRFAWEFLRADDRGGYRAGLSVGQWMSLGAVGFGIVWFSSATRAGRGASRA